MDLSELEFWSFLAVAVPILLMPVGVAWWKGSRIGPVALLSLVFWPGALILALRLRSYRPRGSSEASPAMVDIVSGAGKLEAVNSECFAGCNRHLDHGSG